MPLKRPKYVRIWVKAVDFLWASEDPPLRPQTVSPCRSLAPDAAPVCMWGSAGSRHSLDHFSLCNLQ